MSSKPTNPKDAVGSTKPPLSTIPAPVLFELGNALFEGHLKYGGHNWRAMGVRAGVYYDACMRHLASWWAGEDTDPDSGMHHVTKAIAGLVILRDAMIHDMLNDDRPPKSPADWMADAKKRTLEIIARYGATAKTAFMEQNREEWKNPDPGNPAVALRALARAFEQPCPYDLRDPLAHQDEGRGERSIESDEFQPLDIAPMPPYFEDSDLYPYP